MVSSPPRPDRTTRSWPAWSAATSERLVRTLIAVTAAMAALSSAAGVAVAQRSGHRPRSSLATSGGARNRSSTTPPSTTGATATASTVSAPTPSAPKPVPSGYAMGAPSWTNTAVHPVSGVAAMGGRFLAYGSSAGSLKLFALDPANGRVVWQQPATRSHAAQGIPLEVSLVGSSVVYLRPDPAHPDGAHLVAGDPATGVDRWSSPLATFDSLPSDCGDHANVCAGIESSGLNAFAVTSGISHRLDLPLDARTLGTEIYDFGGRSPEMFGVASATRRV